MWNEISERCRRTMAAGLEMITLPVAQVLALPGEILDPVRKLAHAGIMAWHDHDLERMWCILNQLYGRAPSGLDQFQTHNAIGALEKPQPSGPAAGRGR